MRIQLSIDGATTEQVRDLTVAWGRTTRTTGSPLPASYGYAGPVVGIDGASMTWTSPHMREDQAHQFFEHLAAINKDNDRDDPCLAAFMDKTCTAPRGHREQHTWAAHFNA